MEHGRAGADAEVVPLPASARHFELDALAAHAGAIVIIDAQGIILWMNPAWHRFAEQNQGARVLQTHGPGTLYYDGIAGPLRDYYKCEFEMAARSGRVFEQVYECSSPDVRRLMRLRALPLFDRGLLLEHSCVVELQDERRAGHVPPGRYIDDQGLIVQCSNCRRVRRALAAAWDWVPAWLTNAPAPTSHAICEVCLGFYWGRRLHAALARAGTSGVTE